MSRIIGDLNFTDGGRTGLQHTDQLVSAAPQGIEFTSDLGGFSGVFNKGIYLETRGTFSGVAATFIGLLASGNINIEARNNSLATISGQTINLNAENDINLSTNSRDILATANNAVTFAANTGTLDLRSNKSDAILRTNQLTNGGHVRLISNSTLQVNTTQHIFENSNSRFLMMAPSLSDGIIVVSGFLHAALLAKNLAVVSGIQAIRLVASDPVDPPTGAVEIFGSGSLLEIVGAGNIDRTAWQGNITDTAAQSINTSAPTINLTNQNIYSHSTIADRTQSDGYIFATAQTAITLSGLNVASLVSQNNVHVSGITGLNLIAGPNSAAQINLSGVSDVNIGSSTGNLLIETRGSSKEIHIMARGGSSSMHLLATARTDLQTTSGPIVAWPGTDLIVKPQGGAVIVTARTTNTNTTDGKSIFSNVIANNKAPITISGVNQIQSFMTGANTGDIAMQNPGIESGPGAGRLWLNTGSGLAPISVGSGYFLAYDNITGSNGVSISTVATVIGFNTQLVCDRQYQHDPTGATPTSGTVVIINDGLYKVTYNASFFYTAASVTTANVIKCQIYKNGSAYNPSVAYAGNTGTNNTNRSCSTSTLMFLSAGDQLTLQALRDTGGAARTNNNEVWILLERLR